MVGITTVSATIENVSGEINAQDTITHDIVQTTTQTNNIIKQETKLVEKNDIETISTNKTQTINKDTTINTKSADEPSDNNDPVKKDPSMSWSSDATVARYNQDNYYYISLYDEYSPLENQNVIFKFNNVENPTVYVNDGLYYSMYVPTSYDTVNINVTFPGNDYYNPVSLVENAVVKKPQPFLATYLEPNKIQLGETTILQGSLSSQDDYNYFINQTVTITFNGDNYTETLDEDGTFSFEITPDVVGEYNIFTTYAGDENYDEVTSGDLLTVVDKKVVYLEAMVEYYYVNLGDSGIINGRLYDKNNTGIPNQIIIIVNDEESYEVTSDVNGEFSYELSFDGIGAYYVQLTFEGSAEYASSFTYVWFEVLEQEDSILTIDSITNPYDDDITYGCTVEINGTLTDSEGNPIQNAEIYYNGYWDYTNEYGEFSLNVPITNVNIVDVTVSFKGNEIYKKANDTKTIEVSKANSDLYCYWIEDVTIYSPVVIEGSFVSDVDLTIMVNDETVATVYTDENGYYSYEYDTTVAGENDVTVIFEGNDYYEPTSAETTFYVYKIGTTLTVDPIDDISVGSNVVITGKLVDADENPISNANLTIFVNDDEFSALTDENGLYSYEYSTVYDGDYTANVYYAGNDVYVDAETFVDFSVLDSRVDVEVFLNNIGSQTLGDVVTIEGNLYERIYDEEGGYYYNNVLTGDIILELDGVNYTLVTNEYGYFAHEITPEKLGTFTVKAFYEGNESHQAAFTTQSFDVIKEKVTFLDASVENYYVNLGDSGILNGRLYDKNNTGIPNQIIIIVNDEESYEVTSDVNGEFSYELSFDGIGAYYIQLTFDGNAEYASSSNAVLLEVLEQEDSILTIDSITNPNGDDITYGCTVEINGTLTDSEGNPISNDLIYCMDCCDYADENGKVSLYATINNVGTVDVTVLFKGNEIYKKANDTKTIEVYKANRDIYCYWIDNVSIYSPVVIEGSFVSDVDLTIMVNDETVVTVHTGENGYYSYEYDTTVGGENDVTVIFEGNDYYEPTSAETTFYVNKIDTTLTVESVDNVNVGDIVLITGKLVDSDKNPISNANISIEIPGSTVFVETNEEGIYSYEYVALFEGSYEFMISFRGNNYYSGSETLYLPFIVDDSREYISLELYDINDQKLGNTIEVHGITWNNLENYEIIIQYDGVNYTTTFDENCEFYYNLTLTKLGQTTIYAIFEGDETYQSKQDFTSFMVYDKNIVHLNLSLNYYVDLGEKLVVNGLLYDDYNNGIPNQKIIIQTNEAEEITTDENGYFTYEYLDKELGYKSISFTFEETEDYISVYESRTYEVIERKESILKILDLSSYNDNNNITYNSVVSVYGTLTDVDGNPLNDVMVKVNDKTYWVYDGEFYFEIRANTLGNNTITVLYGGDEFYKPSNDTRSFEVGKSNPIISYYVPRQVKAGDNITIDIYFVKNTTLNIKNNNKTIDVIHLDNSNYHYNYKTNINELGIKNLTIEFEGNDYYYSTNTTVSFNVTNTEIIFDEIPYSYIGETVNITGTLNNFNGPIPHANITLKILGETFTTVTDSEGVFSLNYNPIMNGRNIVDAYYYGDETNYATENYIEIYIGGQYIYMRDNYLYLFGEPPKYFEINGSYNIRGHLEYEDELWDEIGEYYYYTCIGVSNATIIIQFAGNNYTTTTNEKGIFEYNLTFKEAGDNVLRVIYLGNETYRPCIQYWDITVLKKDVLISVNPISGRISQNINLTAYITDTEENNITGGKVYFRVNNETLTGNDANPIYADVINGKATITYTIPESWFNNNNTLEAVYTGSEYYNNNTESTTNITVMPKIINTKITINTINTTIVGNKINISGKLTDVDEEVLISDNVTININGQKIETQTDSNGVYTYTYTTKIVGTNNVTVTYNGNEDYTASNTTTKFTVNKKDTKISIDKIGDVAYSNNFTITGKITSNNNALNDVEVKITINNETFTTKTDNNGKFNYKTNATIVGTSNLTVSYDGNDYHKSSTANTTFNVIKQDLIITIDPIKTVVIGENVTITGKFTNANGIVRANSALKLLINGKSGSTRTDANGVFTYTTKVGVVGVNNVSVSHAGGNSFNPTNTTATYTMIKQDLIITINPIKDSVYGENVTITGKLTDGKGTIRANTAVKLLINNGRATVKTDSNGIFTYTTKIGKVGINNVTVSHTGGTNYNPTNTSTTFTKVKQDLIIKLDSIKQIVLGDNVTITGKLTDANGIIHANTGVKLLINGKSGTAKTDSNGVFTFTTKIGKVGVNNVTVSHLGGANYNPTSANTTYTVVKKDLKITVDPIKEVKFGNTVTITGKFTDGNGIIRANASVKVFINGKTGSVRTDSKGVFTFTSNVGAVGINNVTVGHAGGANYNPVYVNTTFTMIKQDLKITLNAIKQVKSGENVTISGKFTDANGVARKNSKVNIYVNGKYGSALTDNNGLFTYSTKVTKVGTNSVSAQHSGGANYNPTTTNATFTVVN